MAQKVDLYTLLKTYSFKSYSAVIKTEIFIKFLEKNSQRENAIALNIDDWKTDTRGKVLRGLNELVVQNRITITGTGQEQTITLNEFYTEVISKYYQSAENTSGQPFPNETTLRISIPAEQIKTVSIETELINFLSEERGQPNQIIKLMFADNFGSALTLESQYPQKILEYSVAKIQHHFRNRSEMEYYQQKMTIHFRGKEVLVHNFINLLITQPGESIKNIEESSEFMYSLWLFLCPLIKKHIEEQIMRTNDRSNALVAPVQAAMLLLTINNFYQIKAINRRNTDMALGIMFERMLSPPYVFSISDILQFKNDLGALLTSHYTQGELENFLKEKIALGPENKFPEILRFRGQDRIELFVRKDRLWILCSKLLGDVQPQIKNEISQRWMKMLRDFRHEAAMDKDSEFEELLIRICDLFSPHLLLILNDKKLCVLQSELLLENGSLPGDVRFFEAERLIPLRTLLGLRRNDIIHDCKLQLPFWYSIGFIVNFVRFFKGGHKKKELKSSVSIKDESKGSSQLRVSAEKLARILIPESSDIDTYLNLVRDRWNQLLDKTAQKNLTEDINALIRAHLNQVLKLQKPHSFDNQMLEENAEQIIMMNAALERITNKNALRLYIKIYITKLLLAKK
jgi:hypothetical protein